MSSQPRTVPAYERALASVHRFDRFMRRSVEAVQRIEDACRRAWETEALRARHIPLARIPFVMLIGEDALGACELCNSSERAVVVRLAIEDTNGVELRVEPERIELAPHGHARVRIRIASPKTAGVHCGRILVRDLQPWDSFIEIEVRAVDAEKPADLRQRDGGEQDPDSDVA